MNDIEVLNDKLQKDVQFKFKCLQYGIKLGNYEIIDDLIILFNEYNNLCIVLNENYNMVAVETKENLDNAISEYKNKKFKIGELLNLDITLKQIIDISSRVEVIECNHGHTLLFNINGIWYFDDGSEYFGLLSYIKFLANIIETYFSQIYQMKCKSLNNLNIYEYLNKSCEGIYLCVKFCAQNGEKAIPRYVMEYLGKNFKELENQGIIYNIIELFLKVAGYKSVPGIMNKIEKYHSELNLEKDLEQILKDINTETIPKVNECPRQKTIGNLK